MTRDPVSAPPINTRHSVRFDQVVEVETPEQVAFSYAVAGIGSRAAAALIDYLLCILPFLMVMDLLSSLVRRLAGGNDPDDVSVAGGWVTAILMLAQFIVLWGYHVLFEALWDGQTPGKRQMGLRVVQDGGYSVSFAASAVRNLARLLDMQPGFFHFVGLVSVGVSRSGKRIGDLLAGTIVIEERTVHLVATTVPATDAAGVLPVARLTEDEYALLDRFTARWWSLDHEHRAALSARLVTRFGDRLNDIEGTSAEQQLFLLHDRERAVRAAGSAARSDRGAQREQHALVAVGTPRWRAFAERLSNARRRGLRRLPEEEVSQFAADYREIATDLARLQTAARGRTVDALFYVGRLVAGGHNLLYRSRRLALVTVRRYLTVSVPREMRRSWAVIATAALVFFGSAGIAFGSLWGRFDRAREVLPAGMIDRVEGATVRAEKGEGYVDIPENVQPIAASSIIANNVMVTYGVFVFGITAGIGTVVLLLFNGVFNGGFAGLYASTGAGEQLLSFLAPHGVLELSAICIAGGAGFHLALAILLPGPLTRREALVARGRRAVALVAGASLMLVVAGTIEGLISPRDWPLAWKLAVSGATAVLLLAFVSLGRDSEDDAEPETFAYSDARALISR